MKGRSARESGTRPRRGLSWWRRALLGVGLVAVLVAVLELSLWGLGTFVTLGIDRSLSDDGASYTIACVGDSWTQGAPDGRFPDLLAQRLNARGNARFRALNLGLAGTNSSQALGGLVAYLKRERPDLILVMTGNNDHWNLDSSTYWKFEDRSLGTGAMLAARARIFLHSLRVYKLARVLGQQVTGGRTPNEFFFQQPDAEASQAQLAAIDLVTHRRQLEFNLTKFVELARRYDVPVIFQTYFHFHGYRVNEVIRNVASAHQVPLVDNNRSFHELAPGDRGVLLIPDGHPSPRGYAFIADNIVQALADFKLIADQVTPVAAHQTPRE